MVGGPEEEFNAAKELLTCMGAEVVYCGQVGTGQVQIGCDKEYSGILGKVLIYAEQGFIIFLPCL